MENSQKNNIYKLKRVLNIIFSLVLIFSTGIWGSLGLYLMKTIHDYRPSIDKAFKNVDDLSANISKASSTLPDTLQKVNQATDSLKTSVETFQTFTSNQNKELNDPQAVRSRRLLYQSGDNVYRIILALEKASKTINNITLPNVDDATFKLAKVLGTADKNIDNLSIALIQTINSHQQLAEAAKKAIDLNSTKIGLALGDLDKALISSTALIDKTNITVDEFNQAIPQILAFIIATGNNITDITKQIKIFAEAFNKQDPKIIRVLKFILSTGLQALPSIVRTL